MATGFDFASLGNLFAPGGTPSGLDALFNEDQRRLMGRNANLSAAAALLQASGRSRERIGLGQALGSALQAGQQGYQQARAGSLQDLMLGQKLAESQAARARQAEIERIIGTGVQPAVAGMPAQMVENDGGGVGQIPAVAARPAGFDIQAIGPQLMAQGPEGRKAFGELLAAQKTLMGDTFSLAEGTKQYVRDPITGAVREVAAGTPKPTETVGSPFQGQDGKFYIQTKTGSVIPAPVAPMAKPVGQPQQVMGANNKPQLVQYYEDGSYKAVSGVSPLIPREKIDTGRGTLVQDLYSLPSGTVISKGMSQSEAANLALRQQEFARGAFDRVETPDGLVYVPKVPGGAVMPITGPGGQPLKGVSGGNASEGERKAGSLLARLNLAESQMTGEGASGVPNFFTSVSPRVALPEGRKRVEDAQLDFLDAALTLSTGAAYTEAQLKGAQQSYFPKFGDSPATIAEKEVRRKNLAEAGRLAAGRMAPAVDALQRQPTASGGSGQRRSLNNIFGVPQ